MKRYIIFIFFLLITLSTVSAVPLIHKRNNNDNSTGFISCPEAPLNVTVSPDPPNAGQNSTFDISGTLNRTIPDGSQIGVLFANVTDPLEIIGQPFTTSLCSDQVKCPVQPETEFRTSVQVQSPDNLPDEYAIVVAVLNQTQVLGCAVDLVGIDSFSSSPSSSDLWAGLSG